MDERESTNRAEESGEMETNGGKLIKTNRGYTGESIGATASFRKRLTSKMLENKYYRISSKPAGVLHSLKVSLTSIKALKIVNES